MKILFFTRDYTTHDRKFLRKLAESTHDIYFLRLEDDGIAYETRPVPDGIHVVEWPGGRQPAAGIDSWMSLMPGLEIVLDQVRPDLVHAGPVQSCGFMTALTGFQPFIVMSWGSDILEDADRDQMWNWLTRYTLDRADALVCDCQAVNEKARGRLNFTDKSIIQFPWGVDLQMFSPGPVDLRLREQIGRDDSFIILSTRSWEDIYGIDVLLEAFQRAHSIDQRLRLVLLADGSLADFVEQFIDDSGLNQEILRPGRVSNTDLTRYLRASDLYVSCSRSDGTSVSLLEAMATGLPVLVTDLPSNREWVVPGESGWMSPAGDPEKLAELLLEGAQLDAADRERIGSRNREIMETRADWDINFQQLLDAYVEIGG